MGASADCFCEGVGSEGRTSAMTAAPGKTQIIAGFVFIEEA